MVVLSMELLVCEGVGRFCKAINSAVLTPIIAKTSIVAIPRIRILRPLLLGGARSAWVAVTSVCRACMGRGVRGRRISLDAGPSESVNSPVSGVKGVLVTSANNGVCGWVGFDAPLVVPIGTLPVILLFSTSFSVYACTHSNAGNVSIYHFIMLTVKKQDIIVN